MDIPSSPRRADPDEITPGAFRADAVRIVVQAAREFVNCGASGGNRIHHQDLHAFNTLAEAVRVLDVLEGKR